MRQSLPEPYPRPSEPEPLLSRAGLSFPSCPGRDLARPPSGLCRHRSLTAPALPTTPPTCLQGTDPPPPRKVWPLSSKNTRASAPCNRAESPPLCRRNTGPGWAGVGAAGAHGPRRGPLLQNAAHEQNGVVIILGLLPNILLRRHREQLKEPYC